MATSITMHDDATRRVLEGATWYEVGKILDPGDVSPMGITINETERGALGFTGEGGTAYEALLAYLDAVVSELTGFRDQITELQASSVGDRIEVCVSVDRLREAVESGKKAIECYDSHYVDGGLLAQAPDVRLRLLESLDASKRLLAELPAPVEVA